MIGRVLLAVEDSADALAAARIAVEVAAARSQSPPVWVGRVADADQHPTVRFVAGYYRTRPAPAREPVRPVVGP